MRSRITAITKSNSRKTSNHIVMEIQKILKNLSKEIESKNRLLATAEANNCYSCKVKLELELEIAVENYSTLFSALPMLM